MSTKKHNSAIIIFDCWDKHWGESEVALNENCSNINKLVHRLRAKGYCIIHHPSDCTKTSDLSNFYDHNNNLKNFQPHGEKYILPKLPNTDYLKNSQPAAPKRNWRKWSRQNKEIQIESTDYLTEDLSELIHILKLNSIEDLYYVGYHINACLLWTRPTSIGSLRQHINLNTYIIKDLSKALLNDTSQLPEIYSICEKDYSTKLIESRDL